MMSNNMKVEYKGFILKLGTVENYFGDKIQGGYCKELNYKTFNNGNIEKDIANFKNYIDNHPIPQHKLKEKEMTEDKEVQLVNQFISDLNQVLDEMEVVEKNVYYEVVLEAKLMKLMKSYGDSLCLGSSINVYRSHYNHIVKQRQEEKKKPKIYLSDDKGNIISLPCKVREDGYIECEPIKSAATIVGFKLVD